MSDFFQKLGAAAKRAASSVATEVNVAAEEQKVREGYQALGKLYYQAMKNGGELTGAAFAEQCAKIDAGLKRIEELKDHNSVAGAEPEVTVEAAAEVTADEEDFVEVVD